jgi:hypothetical protein
VLRARELVCCTVETIVGPVQFERPYFYCRSCHLGRYPFDEALGVVAGCKQLDMHKAAAQLVTEVSYDTAQALFCTLTGVPFGSERMHTVTNQMAQELTVLDVAPPRGDHAMRGRSHVGPVASTGGAGHRWRLCANASRQRP